ncbi:integrase catalytic domain-containing protein [Trichonephila clavipes]|uniref:Integrase catalytic domain-containing protein n=1 Tax=Trichonephila clavipes TaxID=2585209 RepID=A0A8X6SWZ6_TRICX|nr:integrase catalytic domain-containing protein [Trichonephila clavipes]
MVQEQVLAEIKSLQSKGVVSPNSKLRNLNPFIDSDGLLRVGGRLSNSDLPYVNKHPAILPGNHNLTVQIIVHFHRKNLHTGASSLLHYPTPCYLSLLMGNLPRDRVVPDYPFNCSAIHIEIVSDLTSDAFIATLKRFFSRRGKCAKLYSDNGKTFVGANKELKRFLKLIEDSDDNLAGFLSAECIEWKFIPPRAPSFGGLWEASVKSINSDLKNLITETTDGVAAWKILKDHFEPVTKARVIQLLDQFFGTKYQPGEDVGIFISRVKTAATRLQEAGHKLADLYIGFQLIRWLPQEFQSTVCNKSTDGKKRTSELSKLKQS